LSYLQTGFLKLLKVRKIVNAFTLVLEGTWWEMKFSVRRRSIVVRSMQSVGTARLDDGKHNIFRSSARRRPAPTTIHKVLRRFTLARNASPGQYQAEIGGYLGNAVLYQVSLIMTDRPSLGFRWI
jgi:hypothetical protein